MAGLGFLRPRAGSGPGQVLSSLCKARCRSFGAAAAQLQYDDYEDVVDESEGSDSIRGVQWVIMGDPHHSSTIHFCAQWLSQLLHVPHISVSNLVRQHLNPRSPLFKHFPTDVARGLVVSQDVVFGLLSRRLKEGCFRGETGFILEGIPRTRNQAEILDQIADIDLVLNLKSADRQLVENKLQNGVNFQLQGSQIKLFSDDTNLKEKLRTYAEQNKPLEDYYRKQKKLVDFQVAEGRGERETWKGLLSILQLEHMDSSFQKLNA